MKQRLTLKYKNCVSGAMVQLSGTILAGPVLRHHHVMWPDLFLDEIILSGHRCRNFCASGFAPLLPRLNKHFFHGN